MCFSLEVSLGTGIISYLTGYIVLQRDLSSYEKSLVYWFLIYSTIQFADSLLWLSDMKKNNLNYYTTSILIPFLLFLQVYYCVFIFNNMNHYLVYIGMICLTIYLFVRFNGYSRPFCTNNLSSPLWANKELYLIEVIIFAALVTYPNTLCFITSVLVILFIKYIFKGAIGSLWCLISVYMWLYAYFIFGVKEPVKLTNIFTN
jgi:hypothetical protein